MPDLNSQTVDDDEPMPDWNIGSNGFRLIELRPETGKPLGSFEGRTFRVEIPLTYYHVRNVGVTEQTIINIHNERLGFSLYPEYKKLRINDNSDVFEQCIIKGTDPERICSDEVRFLMEAYYRFSNVMHYLTDLLNKNTDMPPILVENLNSFFIENGYDYLDIILEGDEMEALTKDQRLIVLNGALVTLMWMIKSKIFLYQRQGKLDL